nr:hypothetical protein [Tanacetum cinerariifolium]
MIPQGHSPQSYSPIYSPPHLLQPQINQSSIPPSQQYQSHMDHQTSYVPQIAYHSPQASTQPMTEFPQIDSSLAIHVFSQGDDPIACLNKAMAFLTAVASSRFFLTNNQFRTSSNLRNQATIQDDMVTVQQVQRRQGQSYARTGYKGNATSYEGNNTGRQGRVVKCYNCQDAYDSDYDDVSNAKAVLMASLFNYASDVISEVPHSKPYHNDMDNQNFGKRFVPQQELPAEQAFWLQHSNPKTDQYDISLVKIEASQEFSKYLDIGCSKHMKGNRSQLMNFVSKFLGTGRFRNNQIAKIMGYGDYQLRNVIISRKNTCFILNLEGVDLLSGSRDINLYTISLDDMLKTSLICLLSKASKSKSWLWHCRLSHLNFGTLNKLAKDGLGQGIPKLKFQKDHLCLACALGKNKKSSHQPKAEDTNQEKLYY